MSGGDGNGRQRSSTGIAGLDFALDGGLPANGLYLVQGESGTGKTTLAMQFLLEGMRRGEAAVFATLSETEEELRVLAASHGWDIAGIALCDLQTVQEALRGHTQYTLFHPSEVELAEASRQLLEIIERLRPSRLVIDSLAEMRLLARDSLRFRRQILSLKQHLAGRDCTVLLIDHAEEPDFQLQSVTHGMICLEQMAVEYGGERRRLRIQKVRSIAFREGYHDFSIRRGGLVVYPRLAISGDHRTDAAIETVSSGLPELDDMLGGGVARGTSTLLLGPSGAGKTTIASQYAMAAAGRGERALLYLFDELPAVWIERCQGLGMPVEPLLADRRIELRRVDPAELSPGELAHALREEVEQGVRVVVIDSLNGYQNAMPGESYLAPHLRELLAYLGERGVLTLLVMTQSGLVGQGVASPDSLTYLADNVILLRYFEAFGEVRQAISAVKKRTGRHERTIRELRLSAEGPHVGKVVTEFQGVLSGNLTYLGGKEPLLRQRSGGAHE